MMRLAGASISPVAVFAIVAEMVEPGVQGDWAPARKPATLETGLTLQVPLFVNPGEEVIEHTCRASA